MTTTLANQTNSGTFAEDPDQDDSGLLPDLNGVDLVMSLSPKIEQTSTAVSSSASDSHLHDLHLHHHNLSNLQHLQNLQQVNHHHHSFLNSSHSTPFSVTDILSPIEESYRKLELSANPPSPYRYVFRSRQKTLTSRRLSFHDFDSKNIIQLKIIGVCLHYPAVFLNFVGHSFLYCVLSLDCFFFRVIAIKR